MNQILCNVFANFIISYTFSNGNKTNNNGSRRPGHLQNGGQRLTKQSPLLSKNETKHSNMQEVSKYPEKISEESEGGNKDDVSMVRECVNANDKNIEDKDSTKTKVSSIKCKETNTILV